MNHIPKQETCEVDRLKVNSNEVSLSDFWQVICNGRWIIAIIATLFFSLSIVYALSVPNYYKSEALLAPVDSNGAGASAISSQLGGLASIAGLNIGGPKTDKVGLALEIMKSRAFIFKFIERHDITADLVAVESWDMDSNRLTYENIYNAEDDSWQRRVSLPLVNKPSLQESYKEFQKIVSIEQSQTTSLISISIVHVSPYIAQQWVNWLVDDINNEMKSRDLIEANDSIRYLSEQLEKTNKAEIKNALYQLVEQQSKIIMFANIREQYILKTIDPPLAPLFVAGPKRLLISLLGALLGIFSAITIVLVSHFYIENKQ